jgi:hypothetical protein
VTPRRIAAGVAAAGFALAALAGVPLLSAAIGEARWRASLATGDEPPATPVTAPALGAAALRRAQAPDRGREPRRGALLADAVALADAALARRPGWGEAEAVRAYVGALRDGDGAVERVLVASYAHAPYLRDAAAWRVGYGLRRWAALDPATRARVVDEFVWYARLRPDLAAQMFVAVRASPAYAPVMLRWREVREADRDLAG